MTPTRYRAILVPKPSAHQQKAEQSFSNSSLHLLGWLRDKLSTGSYSHGLLFETVETEIHRIYEYEATTLQTGGSLPGSDTYPLVEVHPFDPDR